MADTLMASPECPVCLEEPKSPAVQCRLCGMLTCQACLQSAMAASHKPTCLGPNCEGLYPQNTVKSMFGREWM